MTKYTIKKGFEKDFSHPVWKIVVDEAKQQIGIELRHSDSTCAILYVFDFEGQELLSGYVLEEKEWTLEALQQDTLILKRVGDSLPITAGILLLDLQGNIRGSWHEYTWLDTYQGYLKVRHRNFQVGFEEYIALDNLHKASQLATAPSYCYNSLKMPIPYSGTLPTALQEIEIQDFPWISRTREHILWTYHSKEADHYHLNMLVTQSNQVLANHRLLSDMPKMIPQPFFQIDHQLFLLSYNKRKIVSYLV